MAGKSSFQRWRLIWLAGQVAWFLAVPVALIGWRAGWISAGTSMRLMAFSATATLIWGIAGANRVLRLRDATEAPGAAEERRLRRRAYLVGTIPAGLFLWRRLSELPASPQSPGEVVFLPILWVAAAGLYVWLWGALWSRFVLMLRRRPV